MIYLAGHADQRRVRRSTGPLLGAIVVLVLATASLAAQGDAPARAPNDLRRRLTALEGRAPASGDRATDLDDGGATPEEVFERAASAKDMAALLALMPPAERPMQIIDLFDMVALSCASEPGEWAAGCAVIERHDLQGQVETMSEIVESEAAIGYPDRVPVQRERALATFAEVDVPLFTRELMQAMVEMGMPPPEPPPGASTQLESLQIEGDRAVGRAGEEEVIFVRIGERWYMALPGP